MLTNGYLLNEEFIKKISKYKILVQVSLDGSSEKTNSKQRGEGNFDKVSDNIKLLKKYNIPVIVAVVLNKFNYNDIFNGSMTNLCEDLKVNTLAITPNVIKISNALKNEENFLNVDEVLDVIKFINDYNSSNHNNLNIILSVPPAFTEDLSISNVRKPRSRCRRGSNSFSIRPDGRIVVCSDFTELNYAEYEMGNILTDEFSTILNKLKKICLDKNSNLLKIKGVCSICKELEHCGGACRASAYAQYGDILAPYPLCQEIYEANKFPKNKINFENIYKEF